VFGEQVAAAIGLDWLDHVQDDMEAIDYACGAVVLPACSVGAPHIRQRLWFVANSNGGQSGDGELQPGGQHGLFAEGCGTGELAESNGVSGGQRGAVNGGQDTGGDAEARPGPSGGELSSELGNADDKGPQGYRRFVAEHGQKGRESAERRERSTGFWYGADWLPCRDGKARPVEPGTFPLAHGVSARVGRLRGYGNAIVPQVAAEFIRSYMACPK